jgi:hypothetical protein
MGSAEQSRSRLIWWPVAGVFAGCSLSLYLIWRDGSLAKLPWLAVVPIAAFFLVSGTLWYRFKHHSNTPCTVEGNLPPASAPINGTEIKFWISTAFLIGSTALVLFGTIFAFNIFHYLALGVIFAVAGYCAAELAGERNAELADSSKDPSPAALHPGGNAFSRRLFSVILGAAILLGLAVLLAPIPGWSSPSRFGRFFLLQGLLTAGIRRNGKSRPAAALCLMLSGAALLLLA